MPTMPDKYGYISLTKLSLWLRNFLAAGQKQKYKYNLINLNQLQPKQYKWSWL